MASTWQDDDRYWREHYGQRPYARGRSYEELQSAYRFGHDAAVHYRPQQWEAVEPRLAGEWKKYEHRNDSTWDEIKDAVRDAWDRIVVATFPTM